ncbi:MAG: haloacid dehalogenase type II, partial [Gammaproteobacteria bacterium]|nr:haloacid dehalogenase type II [Gammaproteobacteria bacterium]
MPQLSRRKFLQLSSVAGITSMVGHTLSSGVAATHSYQAIAFDAFPIFDPRPIFKQVEQMFPQQANVFGQTWRSRIFEYTWLRTAAGQYVNFWQCINDGLIFTAKALNVNITPQQHQQLASQFFKLPLWPDALHTLKILKSKNIKIAFLSNMTVEMLNSNIQFNQIGEYIDHIISTDQAKTFKPDPRAYQLGVETLGYTKQNILFTAFAS